MLDGAGDHGRCSAAYLTGIHPRKTLVDIKAAREKYKADIVIPFLHWGWQYRPANERQKQLAFKMIEAGATRLGIVFPQELA